MPGGYEFVVAGTPIREHECPICLYLIKNAVELPCAHTLCGECLNSWQAENQ